MLQYFPRKALYFVHTAPWAAGAASSVLFANVNEVEEGTTEMARKQKKRRDADAEAEELRRDAMTGARRTRRKTR